MKASMLSGTGWGELEPEELKVPNFDNWNREDTNAAVWCDCMESLVRGRRMRRRQAEKRRGERQGLLALGLLLGFVILAVRLGEVLA